MYAKLHQVLLPRLFRPLLLAFALFYLAFHAVSGERGLYAWFRESKRLEFLQASLKETQAKREGYERNIKLLRPESIDLDMLDEQARQVLGFVGADEVVVYTEK